MQLMCVLGCFGKNCVHRVWGYRACELNHIDAKVDGAMGVCSYYVDRKELNCRRKGRKGEKKCANGVLVVKT